jgi:AcrR family transcriptional regulator
MPRGSRYVRGMTVRRRLRAKASGRSRAKAATRPRVRLDNDARRTQLLALAEEAFTGRAYDEVSIDDIARAAGISKGLLYHYFPTKRDLYVEVLQKISEHLIERTTMAGASGEPLERIRAGLDAFLDHVAAHADSFVALMRGGVGSDPEVATVIEATRRTFAERMLTDELGSPLAAVAKELPMLRTAVRGWIGLVEAASIDWVTHRDVDRIALRDLLVDSLLLIVRRTTGESLTS